MAQPARHVRHTHAEYFQLERESSIKHEFLEGEIYAMAGGTPDHAALAATVMGIFRAGLPKGCRTFSSDLRIHVPETGLITYPDVSVVCGPTHRAQVDALAVTNPVVLVEVTSPSTEDYDRGEKLRQYQSLPSLREVLIVSHREPRVWVHQRDAEGSWSVEEVVSRGEVRLASVGLSLALDDVYRDALEDAAR